jgi:hypothetical protein
MTLKRPKTALLKKSLLQKQTGEVIENTGSASKTNRKRTGNEATQVVENT